MTKKQIRNYRTAYSLTMIMQGKYQYADTPKNLRIYACEMFIEKFFIHPDGSVLALHEAMIINQAKDDESKRLLLKSISNAIVYEEAYDELYEKIDDLECLQLIADLKLKKDPFLSLLPKVGINLIQQTHPR